MTRDLKWYVRVQCCHSRLSLGSEEFVRHDWPAQVVSPGTLLWQYLYLFLLLFFYRWCYTTIIPSDGIKAKW